MTSPGLATPLGDTASNGDGRLRAEDGITEVEAWERIGVMGAGVMGSGIAQVLAVAGHEVVCRDLDDDVLESARASVTSGRFGMEGTVARGKISADDAAAALDRLTFTTDLDRAVDVDVIVEAVPEDLGLKIRFWRELDGLAPEHTIFASNSSGFSIAALAAATERADRMIGWHWASPAPVMKLAEIVRGPDTSDATVDTVVRLGGRRGQEPGRGRRHRHRMGVRRQPRLLRDGARGQPCGGRGDRHP